MTDPLLTQLDQLAKLEKAEADLAIMAQLRRDDAAVIKKQSEHISFLQEWADLLEHRLYCVTDAVGDNEDNDKWFEKNFGVRSAAVGRPS